jgi:hypothetical protein
MIAYSRQPLLVGGTRVSAANQSGGKKSIYAWPRGTNGLAPPFPQRRIYHARLDITTGALLTRVDNSDPGCSRVIARESGRFSNPGGAAKY